MDENAPFTAECDASNFAIAAVLYQNGRPVALRLEHYHAVNATTQSKKKHHPLSKLLESGHTISIGKLSPW